MSRNSSDYVRKWRAQNPTKCAEYSRRWRERHPEKHRETSRKSNERRKDAIRAWAKAHPEVMSASHQKWRSNGGQEKMNEYNRKKWATDVNYRLGKILRHRVRVWIGKNRAASASELLGCTIENFKIHIESQFQPGMTWENHGKDWEIDHIMPISIFDLSKSEHQKRCFHFSNHQPLPKAENRRKSNKGMLIQ